MITIKVKICGLANYNDALDATNLGADFLGFHFIKNSPRKVSEKLVLDIVSKLPPFVALIAVFLVRWNGFDTDSSIERLPKRKDYDKMSTFIKDICGLKI